MSKTRLFAMDDKIEVYTYIIFELSIKLDIAIYS